MSADTQSQPPMPASEVNIADVKQASRQGVVITFAAQFGRFGCQFVAAVIMARLLSPAEFGITAMAYPLIAFLQLFVDLGLSQATIQRPHISQAELSFMFWVGLCVSIMMGLIVLALSPLAGMFYHEPRVTGVLVTLGVIVMFSGTYSQHAALLNRRLQFRAIGVIDLGSYAFGALAGIIAAMMGWSYWSVVVAQGVTTAVAMVLYWSLTAWVPSAPASVEGGRSLLGFGGNVTSFNIINYFARNLDNILIGHYVGELQLGLYDRAYRLLILPLSQITTPLSKVATPLMARTMHIEGEYRLSYGRMLETSLLLTYPAVIFAGVDRENLILTVLGTKWAGTIPIFGVLAIGALFAPISNSTSWLLTTQNRTREMRNYGAISSIAFVLSFIAGLRGGALGVAECYIAVGTLQGPLLWWATTRRGPVSNRDLAAILLPYMVAGLPTGLGVLLITHVAPNGILSLGLAFIMSYVLFPVGLALTPGGRKALNDVRRQVASLLAGL